MSRTSGLFLWGLGAAILAMCAAIPFLDFVAVNPAAFLPLGRLTRYYAQTLALGLALTVVQALLLRAIEMPAWRALPVAAVQLVILFEYHSVRAAGLRYALPETAVLGAWLLLLCGGSVIALTVVRTRAALTVTAVFVLLMAAVAARTAVPRVLASRAQVRTARIQAAVQTRVASNVYWIVLDGYPRADVLASQFGYDNSRFLDVLETRGFALQQRATANYPITIDSVAATLQMAYPVTADTPVEDVRAGSVERYAQLRGENRTIERFRSLGYRYVHFANGYDHATGCGDPADACIVGSAGVDEVDVALLSRTPFIDAAMRRTQLQPSEASFMRGSVIDLLDKLPLVREVPAPYFVYAHVLLPHPPFRFDAACGDIAARPDLTQWSADMRPHFIEQLECTNRQTLALLDALLASDPEAVVILQSDHGSAFQDQFSAPAREWSGGQVAERFSILSAMRLAQACHDVAIPEDFAAVHTFPLVFSCLTGEKSDLLPVRRFVTSYETSREFGIVVEY